MTQTSIVASSRELIAELAGRGLTVRALGGVAIALRCPAASDPALARRYEDLDLITDSASGRRIGPALAELGYSAYERFNALHGHARMMFTGRDDAHVDVLVDAFVMCHRLDLRQRLAIDEETLSISDLLLTKLQIARLNRKDVVDIAALLLDHSVTDDDTGINHDYIASLLGGDWGWWRTATENLAMVGEMVGDLGLPGESATTIDERVRVLVERIASEKKSLRWKTRARLGDRVAWRLEPEEVGQ